MIERISDSASRIISGVRRSKGENWQIFGAKLAANPAPITAEANGAYIYQGQVIITYIKNKEE